MGLRRYDDRSIISVRAGGLSDAGCSVGTKTVLFLIESGFSDSVHFLGSERIAYQSHQKVLRIRFMALVVCSVFHRKR